MLNVGIIGVTGYTGIELLRLLQSHTHIKVKSVFTASYAGQAIAEVYPHLQHQTSLQGEKLNLDEITQNCDLVFMALPHGHAIELIPPLLAAGKKIIDLGADFRLKNQSDYQHWYQHPAAPETLLQQAVYGLPEKGEKENIKNANLIANPGCYPTASILATLPALKADLIDPDDLVFDAKSGLSGAGRTLSLNTHYCEASENVYPYQIAGAHRHTPEIEQELSLIANKKIIIQFTPHLVPMTRGLLVTSYLKLKKLISKEEIYKIYKEIYHKEPFIRLCDHIPQVKHVKGSNFCDIGIQIDARTQRLIVVSVIDNLIKGAAGQAIQNMNLMYQFPENFGLNSNTVMYP
ncbi:MAG: N-acetyl-gamma-glutamyl-phosphate reductase [Gammaproteobacteria bacterium RIFCSPHIGHO2_12_38_15]|nr:MAG: N-acetyl-gamma-glutamyl-phosphate reductase [Gammaproteobacteria bacterium RIFCSPHIGHO2_12_38_15]